MSNLPAQSGRSRVFLIEGRARPDHAPVYKSCIRAGAPDWGFGDTESIECPDPNAYSKFIEVGEIQGGESRPTTDLMGNYPHDEESDLLRLAKAKCSIDVHVHFGRCQDPSSFNDFDKAVVYPNVRISNWSADEFGALTSDDQSKITETAEISAKEIYEILPLSYSVRGSSVTLNPIVDVVICDTASCGDCETESDGCEIIYAVDEGTTGSPGTAPDLLYSIDGGATFAADDVSSLDAAEPATGVACVGDYVVVISNTGLQHNYKLKTDINAGTALLWTAVAAGYVAAKGPNDIWSVGTYAFVVGDGGYVYGFSDPTVAVTVLDAGEATTGDLNAVHAASEDLAVAVGDGDVIIYTKTKDTWTLATATGGGGDLYCVWVKNEDEWWVGDSNGDLYYTLDSGASWTVKALPGALWSQVNDIQFPKDGKGFVSADKSTTVGYILESHDGGYSWDLSPQNGSLVAVDSVAAIATCVYDVNLVVGVGTADNATAGVILIGQD